MLREACHQAISLAVYSLPTTDFYVYFGIRVLQLECRLLSCPSITSHVDCTLQAANLPQKRQQETRLAAPRWAVNANQLPRSDLHRDVTKGSTLELRGVRPVSTPARQQRCRNFFNLSFFLPFAVMIIFFLFLAILAGKPPLRGIERNDRARPGNRFTHTHTVTNNASWDLTGRIEHGRKHCAVYVCF